MMNSQRKYFSGLLFQVDLQRILLGEGFEADAAGERPLARVGPDMLKTNIQSSTEPGVNVMNIIFNRFKQRTRGSMF
jgi:hypothetical protein